MENTSDKEQVEALKKWWDANGASLLLGLAIGLGGLGGWKIWQNNITAREVAASIAFEQVTALERGGDVTDARTTANNLVANYGDSGYADLAGLLLARYAVSADDREAAKAALARVAAESKVTAVADLARIRLARLLLAEGNADGAWLEIEAIDATNRSSLLELRGDIRHEQARADDARREYADAISAAETLGLESREVQLKLDDLGPGNS